MKIFKFLRFNNTQSFIFSDEIKEDGICCNLVPTMASRWPNSLQGWAYDPVLGFKINLMAIKQSYIEVFNTVIKFRNFSIVLNKEDISSYYTTSLR